MSFCQMGTRMGVDKCIVQTAAAEIQAVEQMLEGCTSWKTNSFGTFLRDLQVCISKFLTDPNLNMAGAPADKLPFMLSGSSTRSRQERHGTGSAEQQIVVGKQSRAVYPPRAEMQVRGEHLIHAGKR